MRVLAVTLVALTVAACAILGGGGAPDPLAGWAGVWSGSYYGSMGDAGPLELEFSTDTAGLPAGLARFDTGMGPTQAPLEALALTADSVRAMIYFEGMSAEIAGTRTEDKAEGSYVVRPEGQDEVVDSGSWEIARQPGAGG
ncbi:MAG: hypothetical protein JSU87_00850 [Gemmatimonadota bacterium]|nr:MAG: hypothetical protein JSU87_00850 [Gemmatimonadota bacterium]